MRIVPGRLSIGCLALLGGLAFVAPAEAGGGGGGARGGGGGSRGTGSAARGSGSSSRPASSTTGPGGSARTTANGSAQGRGTFTGRAASNTRARWNWLRQRARFGRRPLRLFRRAQMRMARLGAASDAASHADRVERDTDTTAQADGVPGFMRSAMISLRAGRDPHRLTQRVANRSNGEFGEALSERGDSLVDQADTLQARVDLNRERNAMMRRGALPSMRLAAWQNRVQNRQYRQMASDYRTQGRADQLRGEVIQARANEQRIASLETDVAAADAELATARQNGTPTDEIEARVESLRTELGQARGNPRLTAGLRARSIGASLRAAWGYSQVREDARNDRVFAALEPYVTDLERRIQDASGPAKWRLQVKLWAARRIPMTGVVINGVQAGQNGGDIQVDQGHGQQLTMYGAQTFRARREDGRRGRPNTAPAGAQERCAAGDPNCDADEIPSNDRIDVDSAEPVTAGGTNATQQAQAEAAEAVRRANEQNDRGDTPGNSVTSTTEQEREARDAEARRNNTVRQRAAANAVADRAHADTEAAQERAAGARTDAVHGEQSRQSERRRRRTHGRHRREATPPSDQNP